jgi:hypothetical protein
VSNCVRVSTLLCPWERRHPAGLPLRLMVPHAGETPALPEQPVTVPAGRAVLNRLFLFVTKRG